jgi:CubicO group peptidase (beta-lactamase class C family)
MIRSTSLLAALIASAVLSQSVSAESSLAPAMRTRVDAAVKSVLDRTGVPSASVALVRGNEIVYANAYGFAQLEPKRAATPAMRYAVGSISKEFTAAALLLLQEGGALSVDDPAGKWVDGLGPASGASIRSMLSHTSGVRDFWPQDYDLPEMSKSVEAKDIIARWADKPLDFPSGTAWQYSNTGYTIAGLIAEKAAHEPLFGFMQKRIFTPLEMKSVFDFDAGPLPDGDAVGYMRYGLGPLRVAAKEGRGWLFAAGALAMTASDLARWDIALIQRRVLNAVSYRDLETEIRLDSGVGSGYALGLDVVLESGRRLLMHGGEVGGFTAENRIYPDDGTAVVVLTNQDAASASDLIAEDLAKLMFVDDSPAAATAVAEAERILAGLQEGNIDASRLTANARSYFTPQALADFKAGLAPLGKPKKFELTSSGRRGGFVTRNYVATFAAKTLRIVERSEPDGLIEQYTINAK